MKKRILSVLLTLCMIAFLMPMTVSASGQTYLALGDSISTGYGLDNAGTEAFPSLLKNQLGSDYTLVNKAVNGETTSSLLARLSTTEYQNAVIDADLITITIGGNDLMAILYSFLADEMNMSADQVKATLESGTDMTALTAAANAINSGSFVPSAVDIAAIAVRFASVISTIKALNPDAMIITATQYDPYKYLTYQINSLYSLLPSFAPDYIPLADAIIKLSGTINSALSTLNGMLRSGSGYTVADVYSVFNGSSEQLCNASILMAGLSVKSINMDFHPNAQGHRMIASCIASVLPPVVTYTITFRHHDDVSADTVKKTNGSGKLKELPTPTRKGYLFDGWYDAQTNGNKITLDKKYTEDTTLHAYWTVCDHKASTKKPTCDSSAVCSLCGDTVAALGHQFASAWVKEKFEHYHECSVCSAKKDKEDHKYDNACDTNCNTCDYVREVTHRYTALKHDNTHHWYECADCGQKNSSEKTAHSGGNANCAEQALCDVCGAAYGALNENAHDYMTILTVGEATHYYACSRCDAKKDETAHSFTGLTSNGDGTHSGSCICTKTAAVACAGGTATCTDRAVCTACHTAYGELDSNNHTSSQAEYVSNENGTHHKTHTCCNASTLAEFCSGGTATCKGKAVCEHCGVAYGDLAEHTGGTATCTNKAICTVCKESYGEIDPDNHNFNTVPQSDEEFHWHICRDCGMITEKTAHEYGNDNRCVCGAEKDRTFVIIVIASVALLGIVGTALLWFVFKKKK